MQGGGGLLTLLDSQRVAGMRKRAHEAMQQPEQVQMGAGGLADTWYVVRRYMRRAANAVGMVRSAARALLRMSDITIHMQRADAVLKANLLQDESLDDRAYVQDHFRYFFDHMGLYELSIDGELNFDRVNPIQRGAALDADVPTLSVEYLEFLRGAKHYVPIHADAFMSLKGFIDLARCPVLFSINIDAATMLIASLIRIDTDADDLEFAAWRNLPGNNVGFYVGYNTVPLLIFDRYEMLRAALMRFRCCFTLSNERPPTSPAENRQGLLEYFDMELMPWLEKLYESLNTDALRAYPNPDAWKAAMIENMLPSKSVRDLIVENANLTVAKGEVDHQHRAQQLDLYYANLVHGASVRTALQEIWCPHNETEHSERDSEEFLKLMWKSLKDVLNESIASLPVGSSAADATNRFVASIRNVKVCASAARAFIIIAPLVHVYLLLDHVLGAGGQEDHEGGVGEEQVVPHLGQGAHGRGGAAAAPKARRRLPVGRFRQDPHFAGVLLPAPPRGVPLRLCGGRRQALLHGAAQRSAEGQHHRPPALRAVGRDRVPHALHRGERRAVHAAARDGRQPGRRRGRPPLQRLLRHDAGEPRPGRQL